MYWWDYIFILLLAKIFCIQWLFFYLDHVSCKEKMYSLIIPEKEKKKIEGKEGEREERKERGRETIQQIINHQQMHECLHNKVHLSFGGHRESWHWPWHSRQLNRILYSCSKSTFTHLPPKFSHLVCHTYAATMDSVHLADSKSFPSFCLCFFLFLVCFGNFKGFYHLLCSTF